MIPTARLWGVLALLSLPALAAGFFPDLWRVVVGLDAVLLLLAAADGWIARGASVQVQRFVPDRFSVGAPNRIELDVIHTGARALRVRLLDAQPESFVAEPAEHVQRLEPHSRVRLSYRTTPGRRGRFELGDVWLRVLGPLGLVCHERILPLRASVAVYPDLRGASRLLLSTGALDLVNLGLRRLRQDGRGSEFARLRDYAQGDSARDVAWKATARRGRPVTRVTESERSQTLMLCVESGRTMAAHVDGLTRLDHAINAALFLAFVALRNGDRVGLTLFADGVKSWLPPMAGRAQYRRIVDALYTARPERTYVDYQELFREVSLRLHHRALLCVFTDVLDEEQALALAQPLARLARQHVPLCLTARDDALAALVATEPDSQDAAYLHAVAAEALLEREDLKARVAQKGVQLLDVDPQGLGLAAVNRYLDIKARGAL